VSEISTLVEMKAAAEVEAAPVNPVDLLRRTLISAIWMRQSL